MNESIIIEDFTKIEKINYNTFLITILSKKEIEASTVEKLISFVNKNTDNNSFHLISDIRKSTAKVTPEANVKIKEFQESNPSYKSNLIVLDSEWKSIILGIFLKVINLSIPTKSFSSVESALSWVDHFETARL